MFIIFAVLRFYYLLLFSFFIRPLTFHSFFAFTRKDNARAAAARAAPRARITARLPLFLLDAAAMRAALRARPFRCGGRRRRARAKIKRVMQRESIKTAQNSARCRCKSKEKEENARVAQRTARAAQTQKDIKMRQVAAGTQNAQQQVVVKTCGVCV